MDAGKEHVRIRTTVQPITSNKISRNLAHSALYFALKMYLNKRKVVKVLLSAGAFAVP